ncbi:beta-ketoacyl-[acyl-carrier-protein] synthase family protein [Geomobilimonas luticola]|uniref:Beta-ketoacyl-[acyl-carrier-protein] synthase family protein n=1 Tax=Geomobilimonas luticola TaxID=1114878 RepID=A0ABS5SAI4_9BACT|nr:beta-ketoacyl-[acyl-carrier-protein] synthase family protein [Geomobilimonas luticola]MBT0652390.1 beta-ketoacyl-[acyl-carrier-protein] synthase family protein [Geomobilimonas luticola]
MLRKRIAITGLGVFSAAGKNVPAYRDALLNGRSAVGPVDLFDVSPFPSRIGAQVRDFDPRDHFDRRTADRLSRADQFGVIAAGEALTDSGIDGYYSPYDMGVSMGAGAGGMFQAEFWLQDTLSGRKGHPNALRGLLPDRTSTSIAGIYNLAGYQGSITTACSSSATAIGWGADLIATGRQKAVLCGGSDSLCVLTYAGFNSLRVVDPEPCAPFSLGRQGISLGEGAAFVVLEGEDDALRRGARIYGYVLGYAIVGEAYHMTAPEPNGTEAARAMTGALRAAGVGVHDVGWVNAHGTGTPLNDVVESKATRQVFGNRAGEVPLVSTKALTGHCLGAAGAMEALATIIALNEGIIPQTLNFRGVDPECDLEYCHEGLRRSDATVALSNSFAFGGNITSLVIGT